MLSPQDLDKYRSEVGISSPPLPSASGTLKGSDLAAQIRNTPTSSQTTQSPSYLDRVGNDFKSGFDESVESQTNATNGTENPLKAGLNMAKNATSMVLSPISEAISPVISPLIKPVADKLGNTKPVQAFTDLMSKHPELSDVLSDLIQTGTNVAGLMGGEEGAPKVAETAGEVGGKIADTASDALKTVKNTASDIATPLDARIKTMIDNVSPEEAPKMAEQLKGYFDQAKTATKTNVATPYETAGKTQLMKALETLKSSNPETPGLLDKAGQTMNSELEGKNTSIDHTDAESILNSGMQDKLGSVHETAFEPSKFGSLQESMDYIKNLEKNSKGMSALNEEPVSGQIYNAPGRTSRIQTAADRNLIDAAYNSLDRIKNGANTPKQIEDEVSILNKKIADSQGNGAKPIKSPTQAVVSQFANSLNESLKEVGGEAYTGAKETYAKLRPLYDELSNKLGKNSKNAASVAKQAFSPVSSTRDLLQRVEESTGVPIFNHLNMAKFAMEIAHDPRVASLLEQGEKTLGGASKLNANPLTWMKFIKDHLADPEGKAMRMLDEKGKSILDDNGEGGPKMGLSAKDITSRLTPKDTDLMQKFIDDARLKGADKPTISSNEEADLTKMNDLLGIDQDLSKTKIADKYEDIISRKSQKGK